MTELICSYRFSVKHIISRGKGQSVVASAAYIARAKYKDDELGKAFDYSKKKPSLSKYHSSSNYFTVMDNRWRAALEQGAEDRVSKERSIC